MHKMLRLITNLLTKTDTRLAPVKVTYLADVDAVRAVPLRVMVSQFSHGRDGIEAGILGQRERNHIQRLGKRTATVLLHSAQCLRMFQQADC